MSQKQSFIIIPDTNILHDDDKGEVSNPEFQDFWNELIKNYPVSLIIPEVVRGELEFQHYTSCIKRLNSINTNLDELNKFTKNKYSTNTKESKIKKDIQRKFDKWIRSSKGQIQKTPLATIDWEKLQNWSIWREPPFKYYDSINKSELTKNKGDDGGFRDALIYETVLKIQKLNPKKIIIFISKDNLLRTTLDKTFKDTETFFALETTEDALSSIKMEDEQLTKTIAKKLQAKAHIKFYKEGDKTCIWHKDSIYSKIRQEYADYLIPNNKPNPLAGLLVKGSFNIDWTTTSQEEWKLQNTTFEKKVGGNIFHWKTPVIFTRNFEKILTQSNILPSSSPIGLKTGDMPGLYLNTFLGTPTSIDPLSQFQPPTPQLKPPELNSQWVLKSKFYINWHSKVSTDYKFTSINLDSIDHESQKLELIN